MTATEQNLISEDNNESLKYLGAEEDVVPIVKTVMANSRSGNIIDMLFDAINKAFVLGYYRGSLPQSERKRVE